MMWSSWIPVLVAVIICYFLLILGDYISNFMDNVRCFFNDKMSKKEKNDSEQ